MKELYSFEIERNTIVETPYKKKNKKGEDVDAIRKSKKKVKNRVVFQKPSVSDIERAEFFFGQKYNEYINAGFLTKAMLYNKIGKEESTMLTEEVTNAIMQNMESARTIEFYEGSKSLDEDQVKKLENARKNFVETKLVVQNYESQVQGQFSQTAEVKAEERMIEWFIFNYSFYEDTSGEKKQLFPLFNGGDFKEKRESYLELCEEKEYIEDEKILEVKGIFDESFLTLARVVNIWYNKLAKNQEEIDKTLKEIFSE